MPSPTFSPLQTRSSPQSTQRSAMKRSYNRYSVPTQKKTRNQKTSSPIGKLARRKSSLSDIFQAVRNTLFSKQRVDPTATDCDSEADSWTTSSEDESCYSPASTASTVIHVTPRAKNISQLYNCSVGLQMRSITVVEVHILDMENILHSTPFEDFAVLHTSLVEAIDSCVSSTEGATFTVFEHDRFLISFNSQKTCSENLATKAAAFSMKLRQTLEACNKSFPITLPMMVCVCTGGALVSVLGTKNMKNQSLHGFPLLLSKVMRNSLVLAIGIRRLHYLCKDGNVLIVMDENTKEGLSEQHMQHRQIDMLDVRYNGILQTISTFELQHYSTEHDTHRQDLNSKQIQELKKQQDQKNLLKAEAWGALQQNNTFEVLAKLKEASHYNSLNPEPFEDAFDFLLLSLCGVVKDNHKKDFSAYRLHQKECDWSEVERMQWKSVLVAPHVDQVHEYMRFRGSI